MNVTIKINSKKRRSFLSLFNYFRKIKKVRSSIEERTLKRKLLLRHTIFDKSGNLTFNFLILLKRIKSPVSAAKAVLTG